MSQDAFNWLVNGSKGTNWEDVSNMVGKSISNLGVTMSEAIKLDRAVRENKIKNEDIANEYKNYLTELAGDEDIINSMINRGVLKKGATSTDAYNALSKKISSLDPAKTDNAKFVASLADNEATILTHLTDSNDPSIQDKILAHATKAYGMGVGNEKSDATISDIRNRKKVADIDRMVGEGVDYKEIEKFATSNGIDASKLSSFEEHKGKTVYNKAVDAIDKLKADRPDAEYITLVDILRSDPDISPDVRDAATVLLTPMNAMVKLSNSEDSNDTKIANAMLLGLRRLELQNMSAEHKAQVDAAKVALGKEKAEGDAGEFDERESNTIVDEIQEGIRSTTATKEKVAKKRNLVDYSLGAVAKGSRGKAYAEVVDYMAPVASLILKGTKPEVIAKNSKVKSIGVQSLTPLVGGKIRVDLNNGYTVRFDNKGSVISTQFKAPPAKVFSSKKTTPTKPAAKATTGQSGGGTKKPLTKDVLDSEFKLK